MSGHAAIGEAASVAELLVRRAWERPRRTMLDGELYEAIGAQRAAAASEAAVVTLSDRARPAQAEGSAPGTPGARPAADAAAADRGPERPVASASVPADLAEPATSARVDLRV